LESGFGIKVWNQDLESGLSYSDTFKLFITLLNGLTRLFLRYYDQTSPLVLADDAKAKTDGIFSTVELAPEWALKNNERIP
jgi:hypothetical protein